MSDKLVRIKNRYDTVENWDNENPVLAAGEIGIDSSNSIIKVGNGSSNWNNLSQINYSKYTTLFENENIVSDICAYAIVEGLYDSSNESYKLADDYMITIDIPGYFSSKKILKRGYIINNVTKFIQMNFIPLTDANIDYDSLPNLMILPHLNSNPYNIKFLAFTIDGFSNYPTQVLNLERDGETFTFKNVTCAITIEKVCNMY